MDFHRQSRHPLRRTNLLVRTWESLTERGFRRSWESARSLVEDIAFDLRYGTDTRRRVHVRELGTMGEKAPGASSYVPTRGRAFKGLLRNLTVVPDSVFVDLGSGKGKLLLLASDEGFRKVVGIEFSHSLSTIAKRNAERYSRHTGRCSTIEIVCCDAGDYVFRPDENVFFMFHPFGASVMDRVVRNLRKSLVDTPRRVWIVYTLPLLRNMLEEGLGVHEDHTYVYGGFEFVIFTNAPPTDRPGGDPASRLTPPAALLDRLSPSGR
jgi:SAM-dependent methyltransferase